MNGLLGSSLFGNIFSGGSVEFYSLSGKQSPWDNALMLTPILFLVSFYFILVTSSSWPNRSFDLLCAFIIYEKPLFLAEYWHIDGAVYRSSYSERFNNLLNLDFRLWILSLLIVFYWKLSSFILGRNAVWFPMSISAYFGLERRFIVNPNRISSYCESFYWGGASSRLNL